MSKYDKSDYERAENHFKRCKKSLDGFNAYYGDKEPLGNLWCSGTSATIEYGIEVGKTYVSAMMAFNQVAKVVYPNKAEDIKDELLLELQAQMDILDNLYSTQMAKKVLSRSTLGINIFYTELQNAYLSIKAGRASPPKQVVKLG